MISLTGFVDFFLSLLDARDNAFINPSGPIPSYFRSLVIIELVTLICRMVVHVSCVANTLAYHTYGFITPGFPSLWGCPIGSLLSGVGILVALGCYRSMATVTSHQPVGQEVLTIIVPGQLTGDAGGIHTGDA